MSASCNDSAFNNEIQSITTTKSTFIPEIAKNCTLRFNTKPKANKILKCEILLVMGVPPFETQKNSATGRSLRVAT